MKKPAQIEDLEPTDLVPERGPGDDEDDDADEFEDDDADEFEDDDDLEGADEFEDDDAADEFEDDDDAELDAGPERDPED